MADNNKISIEIEINSSGQQQLNQYKNAFDGLRTSINNLSGPISKLDGEVAKLNKSLSETGTQNNIVSDTINKLNTASKDTRTGFVLFDKAVKILETGIVSLRGVLSGGLTLLLAFAPEIINWYNEVLHSGEAADEAKLKISSMNDALGSDAYTKAVTEINQLKINVDLSKKSFIDKKEVIDQYNGTVGKTMGQVSTLKEVEEKLTKNGDAYIEMTMLKASAQIALQNAAKKAYEAQQLQLKGDAESATFTDKVKAGFKNFFSSTEFDGSKGYDDDVKKYGAQRKAQLAETATKEKNELLKIAKKFEEDALNISKSNNLNYFDKKPSDTKLPSGKTRAKAKVNITPKDKPAPVVVEDKPREAEILPEAKSAGININTNKTDPQKQKEILDLNEFEIKAKRETQEKLVEIERQAAKAKAESEDNLAKAKIHAGDKYIDAVLKNAKKDSAIYKAAFIAKKATAIADTIITTKRAIMESLKGYAGMPFIGQVLGIAQAAFMGAQGAMSIAEIAKQKPGYALGGHFVSDGRGALLSGYSRTDNTNAYLRSGEAVVVSEAMRDPWARNLVSAINVAYGGRDFSMSNPGRGYAIGGIFTDGGNSNRYYSAPVNDQKDLANTIAYQMINNFPPVYVDVKDINTQQNIMAQTINRVNL